MPRKVLVVDDDHLVAGFLFDNLARLGYDACEVNSGQEALRMLASDGDFDLVITDLKMPEMDGYQLAKQIKVAMPNLPVVLVTADYYGARHDLHGMQVLPKPYSRQDLKRLMTQVCG